MYRFCTETDFEAFDQFVEEHHGQYQQCSLWPQVKTAWNPYFYSGFDESGTRVLTALVLERNLPVAGKLWYIPYGTVSDYTDERLQRAFADFIRAEMKRHHAFVTIVDPPVLLRLDGKEQPVGHKVHAMLSALGYQLNRDIDSYTYKHPVQTMIPLRDADGNLIPAKTLLKKCEKGVRYSVRVGTSRGLEAAKYTWADMEQDPSILEDFLSVMGDTSDRNSFVSRDRNYLTTLISVLKDYTDVMLVYYDKALDRKLEEERLKERARKVEALKTAPQKKIKGLQNDIEVIDNNTKNFEQRMEETKDYPADARIAVAGGLTIRYGGFASCVFGGTRNIVRNNTRSSHYLNYLRLCESIDQGMDFHDLGYVLVQNPAVEPDGTLGPLKPRENFEGICSFKLSFGAHYTEYIGEYLLIGDPVRYFLYKNLMPAAKHVKMTAVRLLRKEREMLAE